MVEEDRINKDKKRLNEVSSVISDPTSNS
jgi:hypothetical protein